MVPVIGGAVASLIGDYIPMSTQRGIEAAIQDLRDRLLRFEARIDPATVDRERFAETFRSIECLGGTLPKAQQRLVEAWAEIHRAELQHDWELLQSGQPPVKIEPLR